MLLLLAYQLIKHLFNYHIIFKRSRFPDNNILTCETTQEGFYSIQVMHFKQNN